MTLEEELEQLRAEKTALRAAGHHKDEKLEQSQQANQDLREGLKQAIIALGHQRERIFLSSERRDHPWNRCGLSSPGDRASSDAT